MVEIFPFSSQSCVSGHSLQSVQEKMSSGSFIHFYSPTDHNKQPPLIEVKKHLMTLLQLLTTTLNNYFNESYHVCKMMNKFVHAMRQGVFGTLLVHLEPPQIRMYGM